MPKIDPTGREETVRWFPRGNKVVWLGLKESVLETIRREILMWKIPPWLQL